MEYLHDRLLNIADYEKEYVQSLQALLNKAEKQTSFSQRGIDGPIETRYSGVPYGAKLATANDTIFRHFVGLEDRYAQILTSSRLKAGPVPYARAVPDSKSLWDDLKGVFITTPEFEAHQVGVPQSRFFVDFTLPSHLPMIEVQKGIYLLPNISGAPIEVPISLVETT